MYESRDGLMAHVDYWNASNKKLARNCNGCGTSGWKGALVPDTIWMLNVNPSCNIHDWDYAIGTTMEEKADADFRFLMNMMSQIRMDAKKSWVGWTLQILRQRRCFTYYQAVHLSDESVTAFNEATLQ